MSRSLQIAIDGPVAAGKSSAAKALADRLNLLYIDTGAMYRTAALATERAGISWGDEITVSKYVPKVKIKLARPVGDKKDGRTVSVYLGSEDVSWKIRNDHIGEGASIISQYPQVRKTLVNMQRQLCQGKDVVMEGRDIGTRVLPDATLKIYMFADLKERVKRKQSQLTGMGEEVTKKAVENNIITRDEREMNRKVDPLRPAKGAWKLDTTETNLEQVVEKVVEKISKL